MTIKETNLTPYEGTIKAGQRLVKVGDMWMPVGVGGMYGQDSSHTVNIGKGVYYKCASVDTGKPILQTPNDATSNNGSDYTISASSYYGSGYEPYRAFAGLTGEDQGWFSEPDTSSAYLQIQFTESKSVNRLYLKSAQDSGNQVLTAFSLLGSNDGESWTVIYEVTSDPAVLEAGFDFDTVSYTHYRVNMSNGSFSYIGLQKFELYYKNESSKKTWTGYLAVLGEDSTYSFEETETTGLTYTKVIPVVGKIYSADALVIVSNLYVGFDPNTLFLLDVNNMVDKTGNFEVATQGEFTRSPGLFGNRLEFPSMQMVTFSSSNVSFGGTEDYTVEFFYTRIGDGVYPPVFSASDFQVHGDRDGISLTIWQQKIDNMTIAYDSYTAIGVTKHIAFSRRASDGNWKFWVNGQMVSDWNYGTGSANASMTESSIGNWNNDRNNGFAIEEYRISRGLRYTTDTFDVPTGPLN